MKFGVCNLYDKIPIVKSCGYDYIELGFNTIVQMSDTEFKKVYKTVERYSFPAESYNSFFPKEIKLVGDSVDSSAIRAHASKGFARATELGGKIVVLGSGGARAVPDGFDKKRAEEQFIEAVKICGDEAGKLGMEIVIEPLEASETNFINTVAEALELCERVNHENVNCLVDFYHVFKSGESLDAIENSNGKIHHAHIARANEDRRIPTAEDIGSCQPWSTALKKCGYDARLSLEGSFYPDFKTAIQNVKPVLELFK